MNNNNGCYTRVLLDLKRLCEHYGVDNIYINQKDDNDLVAIPPKRDVYIPLRCWIAWDFGEKQMYINKERLVNPRNHWLNTLRDDLRGGRIDYRDYC